MSRQLGSLHRSNSHPTNLKTPITIIPFFAFPPPDFPTNNITSGMNSDTNSNLSVLYSISQLHNPNIEIPDEFADSEPSPSNNLQINSSIFSTPPFQPIPPNNPLPSISTPELLSLPSTPSISQISPTPFPLNFPNNLDARYREQSSTNIPLRLDWNTFTAPPPLFGQHPESNRLHNWALNRLQYRQDIHEDIRDHNIQILQQNSLQLKFEITVKLNNIAQNPYPLNPPNITAQSLPPPFITTEVLYKYDRYTKKTIGYITFYNPYSGLSYTCIF